MAKMKEDTTESGPIAKVYEDESEFKSLSSDYSFWGPLIEHQNAAGVTTKTDLVTLRGIPIVKRERKIDDRSKRDASGNFIHQTYYMVKLTAPCLVKTLDKEIKEAQVGENVWVDSRAALEAIAPYLPQWQKSASGIDNMLEMPTAVFEVILRPVKRVSTRAGFRVWKFDMKVRRINAPKGMDLLPPATPEYSPEDTISTSFPE